MMRVFFLSSGFVRRYTPSNGSGHRFELGCLHQHASAMMRVFFFVFVFCPAEHPLQRVRPQIRVQSSPPTRISNDACFLFVVFCSAVHPLQRVRPQIRVLSSPPTRISNDACFLFVYRKPPAVPVVPKSFSYAQKKYPPLV